MWGPGGHAWHRRHLYKVATPSLLPELIPVWPLAVKVTVSRGGHAKHIGKEEGMTMGTVNPAWSTGLMSPLAHRRTK